MARTHGHGNPNWTREETILALDLYFNCGGVVSSRDEAKVQELSKFLRSLPYHAAASRKASFRNPDGVAFKLHNLDSVATGRGLKNASAMDRQIWSEFGAYPEKIKQLAKLIRDGVAIEEADQEQGDNIDDLEFPEGRTLTELHKRRERNRKIRKLLIESRRKKGPLACDICNDTSKSKSPEIGDAMFEGHHLKPIAMAQERKTRLADMALLCANCHRLLHRAISTKKSWLSISEFRSMLS